MARRFVFELSNSCHFAFSLLTTSWRFMGKGSWTSTILHGTPYGKFSIYNKPPLVLGKIFHQDTHLSHLCLSETGVYKTKTLVGRLFECLKNYIFSSAVHKPITVPSAMSPELRNQNLDYTFEFIGVRISHIPFTARGREQNVG